MSLTELILTLFSDPNGGGKAESSTELPMDYATIGGEVMTISGDQVTIQGATE